VVFLDRGGQSEPVESFLDVHWIEQMPLETSSTRIRGALQGQEPLCELAALPFTAYCMLCTHPVNWMQRAQEDRLEEQYEQQRFSRLLAVSERPDNRASTIANAKILKCFTS